MEAGSLIPHIQYPERSQGLEGRPEGAVHRSQSSGVGEAVLLPASSPTPSPGPAAPGAERQEEELRVKSGFFSLSLYRVWHE